ncbi:hypothetical protein PG593_08545 [Riemerella anatipestifer]|nr:hypothetical protein [Riemerella anatipestifer]
MYCQTVIKRRNAFRGFVGSTTETRRSDDGAVRSKKRLPKWQKGKFTKHYFEGTSRIVSKLGEGTFHQPTGLMAGGIDYIKQSAKIQEAIDQYIKGLNIPPGPPTQHSIYGTPDFTGVEYPSIDWSDISQDQEPPEGWPRPPKFNEPGDVPGPPVQYGDPVKPETVEGGFGFKDNGVEEKNLYFYHPDHLGSSSYITDANGDINQHTEYMAFGEVLFDEHKVSRRMPYLFNGKELDSETGLYYYGARYYDPRVSIFLNVDPLVEKTMQPYAYTNNNPIMLIDPTGMAPEHIDPSKIFEKNEDGSYKNPNLVKAWNHYATSKEGIAFLSQYAAPNQKVAGVQYGKNGGKYHNKGINLIIGDFGFTKEYNSKNLLPANGMTVDEMKGDGIDIIVDILASGSAYSNLETIIHETVIHAEKSAIDYFDNRKLDQSAGYDKDLVSFGRKNDYSKRYYDHYQERRDNKRFKIGVPIIKSFNHKNNIRKSDNDIKNDMRYVD